jgi:hypothetical protein
MTNEQVLQVIDRKLASKRLSAALMERLLSKRSQLQRALVQRDELESIIHVLGDAVLRLAKLTKEVHGTKA